MNKPTHHVRILDDAEEALRFLIGLIEGAKHSIDIQYFIVHRGPTAMLLLGLLHEAAERGVQIRVLFDGLAAQKKIPIPFFAEYMRPEIQGFLEKHTNVSLKFYHPLSFPFKNINRRLHGKMLLVDSKNLVSGGRNVGDKFFGKQGPVLRRIYLDRDTYIFCDSAKGVPTQVKKYFDSLWNSTEVVPSVVYKQFRSGVINDVLARQVQKQEQIIREELADARLAHPHLFTKKHNWLQDTIQTNKVKFFYDPIGSKDEHIGTTKALYEYFASAKKEILGQSPYIIPTKTLMKSFSSAQKNGAKISFLTNSISSSPNMIAIAAYEFYKKTLLKKNINLLEYQGEYNLHHKSYVIDSHISILGTFNLDPRSARSNTELLYVIEDEKFADILTKTIERYKSGAVEINSLITSSKKHTNHVTLRRKMLIGIIKLFVPLFKDLT